MPSSEDTLNDDEDDLIEHPMSEWRSELGRALYYAYTDRDWHSKRDGDPPS